MSRPLVKYFGTVTLSPASLRQTIEKQIQLTYIRVIKILARFDSDFEACMEFTKNGGVHYHFMVTTDEEHDEIVIGDHFKGQQFMSERRRYFIFGFSKIEKVKNEDNVRNYLIKDYEKSRRVLNRLGLSLYDPHLDVFYKANPQLKVKPYVPNSLLMIPSPELDYNPTFDQFAEII